LKSSRRDFLALTAAAVAAAGCGSADSMNVANAQTVPGVAPPNVPTPFVLGAQEGQKFPLGDASLTARVLGAQDNGLFEMYDFFVPAGGIVSFHVHNTFDETITVIDGQIDFIIVDKKIRATNGATAFIPRAHNHGFTNSGPRTAHVQLLFTPAARQNEFFTKLQALIISGSPDPTVLASLQKEYDQMLVPLPPGLSFT
jgi:quercetin dioxygenase-like cupin family protein